MTDSAPDIEDLGRAGLTRVGVRLLEETAALGAEVAALGEEIARLEGLKGRPKIKPSGLELARGDRGAGGPLEQAIFRGELVAGASQATRHRPAEGQPRPGQDRH